MLTCNEETLNLLVNQAEMLFSLSLCCDNQKTRNLHVLMSSEPRIGWLVVIFHVGAETPAANRIGWLSKVEEYPCREKDEDEEFAPLERRWTIERLDGSGEFTWVNVAVRCVPQERWDVNYPGFVPVVKGGPIYL